MDIDKERAAFFEWFAENGSQYASLKKAQDPFCAGYRAALASQDTAPPAAVPAQIRHVAVLNDSDRERLDWSVRTLRGLADTDPAPAGFATILSVIGAIKRVLEPSLLDAAPAQAVDALPVLPGCLADRLFEAISMARDSAENDGSNGRIRKWEATAADLRAALAAQPAAPKSTPRDEWPTDAATAAGHLAGLAFGAAPADEIGHCVALIAAMIDAPAGEPVAWLESEESARKTPIKEIMRGMFHTAVWHFSERPQTSNPVWTLHAPVANTSQKVASSGGKVASDHATLGGQAQAVAVPAGWRLVPVEPTEEMLIAIDHACENLKVGEGVFLSYYSEDTYKYEDHRSAYKAALAVAPVATAGQTPLHSNSALKYAGMTPEQKQRLDAELDELGQRIDEHRRSRDRRTHSEVVEFDRRRGDRRQRSED